MIYAPLSNRPRRKYAQTKKAILKPFHPRHEAGYVQMRRFLSQIDVAIWNATTRSASSIRALSLASFRTDFPPKRVALETLRNETDPSLSASFLEELIVRRELADNFCLYRPHYDSVDVFRMGSDQLKGTPCGSRPYNYSIETLEKAQTHDPLWNAAQMEMILTEKMHGWMRLALGKKILEWSSTRRKR